MAVLTVEQIVRAGLTDPTFNVAAGGGDSFENDGQRTFVYIKNGGGGAITATFVSEQTILGLAVADLAVSVGAAGEEVIGPFPAETFNDSNNRVAITYSGVTSVTIAVMKL